MLRKTMIALFAAASVAVLAPDAALARGGGIGMGGGGFHGVVVSTAAGLEWAAAASGAGAIGMAAAVSAGAAIGGGGFRSAAMPAAGIPRWQLCHEQFPRWHPSRIPASRFPVAAAAIGFGLGYGAYDMATATRITPITGYDDGYYGDGGCYVVQRRV